MTKVITIGLDIGKNVFQVHGVDASGEVVVRRRLRRGEVLKFLAKLEPTTIGIEACATAQHWARALAPLGHTVRLMPARYVKAYVKRQKNDATDAAAICEAVTRPTMHFVPVKTVEQQAALMLHRARDLLIRQRTMLVNALRGHLAEFGLVRARGAKALSELLALIEGADVPPVAQVALRPLVAQLAASEAQIAALDGAIREWHQNNEVSRRLATVPGIGPLTASAIAASVPDAGAFANARQFAAWLGLVPRQNTTGGKPRLGSISKQGNAYIRRLLIIGAQSVLRWTRPTRPTPWLLALLARRPRKVVAVALANKMARIVWALLARGEGYRHRILPAAA
jgi:transposase